jgi:hypothetical protein
MGSSLVRTKVPPPLENGQPVLYESERDKACGEAPRKIPSNISAPSWSAVSPVPGRD